MISVPPRKEIEFENRFGGKNSFDSKSRSVSRSKTRSKLYTKEGIERMEEGDAQIPIFRTYGLRRIVKQETMRLLYMFGQSPHLLFVGEDSYL